MTDTHAPPFIGITTYGKNKADHYTVPALHVSAVRRAGGIPVAIPPGELHHGSLLNRINGMILCGGGDVGPHHYHGTHHEMTYMVDEERDTSELELVKRVIDLGMPTFAICRGFHITNVALGGTLYEDLPDMIGNQIQHRLPPREPVPHMVTIKPDTRLMQILNTTDINPMSWHHQGIKKIAPGLVVSATAPDNVIEGIEIPDHPWFLGVQWHPELTAETDPQQQELYNAFVHAARMK